MSQSFENKVDCSLSVYCWPFNCDESLIIIVITDWFEMKNKLVPDVVNVRLVVA